MRKQLLLIATLLLLSTISYCQITFENGYFIDESNQRIECLIKNMDWENSPTAFHYKLTDDAAVQKLDIQAVKEFGINGVSKYIRAVVKIDRSSDSDNQLSYKKNPVFQEETLFLKVIVEGKATLLLYQSTNLKRFFFNTDHSYITQLVYKKYLANGEIAENNHFRQQLYLSLRCEKITMRHFEDIRYHKGDLKRLFANYNECLNHDYVDYEQRQKRDLFNISVKPGLNSSKLSIENSITDLWDTDFDNEFGIRFGVETEFLLPFNKNKWSIIIEPTYQYYNSKKSKDTKNVGSMDILVTSVGYKSIECPIGIRHYFFLNDKSKIFANIAYVLDFNSSSKIEFSRENGHPVGTALKAKSGTNQAFGLGYKYNNKYSLELRYQTSRNILINYAFWDSQYKTVSVIFGLSFL